MFQTQAWFNEILQGLSLFCIWLHLEVSLLHCYALSRPFACFLQVTKLLGQMTPTNVRVDVQTSSFSTTADSPVQQEPWFGMPYITKPIPEELLSQWGSSTLNPELQLPPHNDFLPTDFSLRSDDTATASTSGGASANGHPPKRTTKSQTAQKQQPGTAAHVGQKHSANGSVISNGSKVEAEQNGSESANPPDMVCNEPGLRLWHKLDRQFETPKAAAYFLLSSPAMYESPAAAATTHLLLKLLEDALCETAYLADVAGLSYDVSITHHYLL